MAIQYLGTNISGIASDTKPTLTANEKGVIFIETDTNKIFQWDTDSWNQVITSTDVAVGALDSGSITSNFGTINTGASAITTTGLISGGSLDIDDVLINGTTIGHTNDTDLITVADGIVTIAGEISATTLDIGGTNVTSTAAEINLLDALDRGSILYGNASGVTTVLGQGGADTVLTSDGTDIAWQAAGGGGGTIDLVADGAIAAGAPVYLTSAGKAKEIKGAWDYPRASTAVAHRYLGLSGTQGMRLHWDDANNKLVTMMHWGSYNFNPVSIDIVDTTNHYTGVINAKGAPGDATYGQGVTSLGYYMGSCYDEDTDRLIIGGLYPSDGTTRAFVCGLSGTTWTMGSISNSAGSGSYMSLAYDKTANKVIMVHRIGDADGWARAGTVTGSSTNSIAWGSDYEFSPGSNTSSTQIVYCTNIGKCVAVYLDSDDNYNYKSVNISVSGTTLSFGTVQTIKSNLCNAGLSDNNAICYDENAEKIVVIFSYNTATSSVGGGGSVLSDWGQRSFVAAVAVGTPSSTTTAWNVADLYVPSSDTMGHASAGARRPDNYYGLDSTWNATDGSMKMYYEYGYMTICYVSDAQKVLLVWAPQATEFGLPVSSGVGTPRYMFSMLGTISGTSISFTSPELLWSGYVQGGFSVGYDQQDDRAVIVFKDDRADELNVIPGAWESGVVEDFNVGHLDQYLGLATAGVSDTATVTITVPGGVNENQSSLVVGSTYYLAPTGEIHNALGRLWKGHMVTVGQAISATKILVGSEGYTIGSSQAFQY